MPVSTSGITEAQAADALTGYREALSRTTLGDGTRAKYAQRVAAYLNWLAATDTDGAPLDDPAARDWAVRDYRTHMKHARKARPGTINNALGAIDDFYVRRGIGKADAKREDASRRTAPKALDETSARRYARAVEAHADARDTVVCLVPYLVGLRVSEVVGLDVDDVQMSARKGELRVMGKGANGGKERRLPIRPPLRDVLQPWLDERPSWAGASETSALLLSRRNGRLSDRSARSIITAMGERVGLGDDEPFGPHVLRHTFATQMIRQGTDIVVVADLLGHAHLDTTRIYSLPTDEDRLAALDKILIDE